MPGHRSRPFGGNAIRPRTSVRRGFTASRRVVHALPKQPAAAIVELADHVDADLVVIDNKGARGARRVLGDVASAVINEAPCAVMVVKTT